MCIYISLGTIARNLIIWLESTVQSERPGSAKRKTAMERLKGAVSAYDATQPVKSLFKIAEAQKRVSRCYQKKAPIDYIQSEEKKSTAGKSSPKKASATRVKTSKKPAKTQSKKPAHRYSTRAKD
jgi:hypothetical protein